MTASLADFVDQEFGTRQVIPWNWLTSSSKAVLESIFKMNLDSEQEFERGFSVHHLMYINMSDVKAIRYIETSKISMAITEIQNLVRLPKYQSLPTLDDDDRYSEDPINAFQVYEEMIRKAKTVDSLSESIFARLEAEFKPSPRDTEIIFRRVPWLSANPETLDNIGQEFNLTRERIRQITKRYERPDLPIVGEIKLFARIDELLQAPVSYDDFRQSVLSAGIVIDEDFDCSRFLTLMEIFPKSIEFARLNSKIEEWSEQIKEADKLVEKISKFRRKMGFINAQYVASELGISVHSAIEAVKRRYPRSISSGDLILARTASNTSTFEGAISKQLLLVEELDTDSLLEGAKRHGRIRNDPMQDQESDYLKIIEILCGSPPSHEYFRAHQESEVEFNDLEKWLIYEFRSSRSGMLHRIELVRSAIRSKVNLGSVTAYCGSSPLLRPHGSGVFSLVGCTPTREEVAIHAELALAQDQTFRAEMSFDASNILYTFNPTLNNYASGVLMPSREVKELFNSAVFIPRCSCGNIETVQVLKLKSEGFWTGFQSIFGHALSEHDYGVNSEFRIYFDFQAKTALLRI